MNGSQWKGYENDVPLYCESETIEKTRADFNLLRYRVAWKMLRTNGNMVRYDERRDRLRKPDYDAHSECLHCGRGYGRAYDCTNGCRIGIPFGCAGDWCLRCEAKEASKRAGKVLDRFNRILQDTNLKIGRMVFTVHPENYAIAGSKSGSKRMMSQAFNILCLVLGVEPKRLAAFATFHPTSSEEPWVKKPHVELLWVHANIDSKEIRPLPIGEDGVLSEMQLDLLKEKWAARYPQTTNIWVKYYDELKHSKVRYMVRPMVEDVWYAIDKGFLEIDQSKDVLGLEPVTIPPEAEAGLREEGGVNFWKSYTRVRYFGAMTNRHFKGLMQSLDKPPIVHPNGFHDCPACSGGELEMERDEHGPIAVSFSRHFPFDGHILLTTRKSNTKTEC